MIRTLIAAVLLRTIGPVEFRVQRQRKQTGKDGTTVLRSPSYFKARKKYRAMRLADTDCITIRVVGTVKQRHGNVEANQLVGEQDA